MSFAYRNNVDIYIIIIFFWALVDINIPAFLSLSVSQHGGAAWLAAQPAPVLGELIDRALVSSTSSSSTSSSSSSSSSASSSAFAFALNAATDCGDALALAPLLALTKNLHFLGASGVARAHACYESTAPAIVHVAFKFRVPCATVYEAFVAHIEARFVFEFRRRQKIIAHT